MTIKKLQDKAFANALKHGFHHKGQNIGELLMLIVSELAEALVAIRQAGRQTQDGYGYRMGEMR